MTPRTNNQNEEEKTPLLLHGADSNNRDRHASHGGIEKKGSSGLSTGQKLLLTAVLYGNEACCDFEHLYSMPLLQLMGMPLSLSSMTGLVAGPVALTLVPFLGWFSDRGFNPNRRRVVTLTMSCTILILGMSCILVANMLHLQAVACANNSDPRGTAATMVSSSTAVPFKAGLVFLGFILLDVSFDSLTSSMKSFLLTVTPRGEHTSLLVLGVAVAAAGGVSTAALGMVDFTSFLGLSHLEGAALSVQSTVQGAFVIVTVVIGLLITLFTGQRQRKLLLAEGNVLADVLIPPENTKEDKTDIVSESEHSLTCMTSKGAGMDVEQPDLSESALDHAKASWMETMPLIPDSAQCNAVISGTDLALLSGCKQSDKDPLATKDIGTMAETTMNLEKSTSMGQSFSAKNLRTSFRANTPMLSHDSGVHNARLIGREDPMRAKSENPLEENTSTDRPGSAPKRGHSLKVNITLVCTSSYLMTGVINTFTMTSSDFVAKAIYGGKPDAAPSSESLSNYQAGVRTASLGFLVYYCAYVVFSSVNSKVLARIGFKGEMLLVHALLAGCQIILATTARIEVYYATAVAAGIHRSYFFLVPYAITNDLIHAEAEKSKTNGPVRTGFFMSLVAASVPLGYLTIFPWVGPAMNYTGSVSFPLYMCAAFAFASATVATFIRIPK